MAQATIPPPLWDGATRHFDGGRLLHAIVARGWTLEEFATACWPPLHPNTIRHAVAGGVCRPKTVLRIYAALDSRRPRELP